MINDTFCGLPLTCCQCIIGTEKHTDGGILLNFDDDDDCSQGYAQIKEVFRASAQSDILQPYRTDDDF